MKNTSFQKTVVIDGKKTFIIGIVGEGRRTAKEIQIIENIDEEVKKKGIKIIDKIE